MLHKYESDAQLDAMFWHVEVVVATVVVAVDDVDEESGQHWSETQLYPVSQSGIHAA